MEFVSFEKVDDFNTCVMKAPLDDKKKNQAALLICANKSGLSNNNDCTLKCTVEAIGVYWAAAAVCIKEQRPTTCITADCPAAVAAFDLTCMKGCDKNHVTVVPTILSDLFLN